LKSAKIEKGRISSFLFWCWERWKFVFWSFQSSENQRHFVW